MERPSNVVICGNYGATNLGDEAILEGILSMVRRALPDADITVMSSNPPETAALHGVKSVFLLPSGPRSLARGIFGGTIGRTFDVLKRADLFILGGGGLFTDEKPLAVLIWSLQARLAAWFHVPIFCLGQSIGPLKTFFGRRMARATFRRARIITVRDHGSADLLVRLGIDDPVELADPAFVLGSPEPLAERREPYVVLSIRPWLKGDPAELYKIIAQFVDWLWETYRLRTIFVPFQMLKDDDSSELNKILVQLWDVKAGELFEYSPDYRKVMELMSRATAVVGMRLHSLIFSSLSHTPFLALSYSEKVRQFARLVEMQDYLLDWENVTLDDLKARFQALLEQHETMVQRLDENVILLRSKALKHEEILRGIFEQSGK